MLSLPRRRPVAVGLMLLLVIPVVAVLPVFSASTPVSSLSAPAPGYKLVGAAPPDLPILVTLALPLRNIGALDSLVVQVSDPASPDYRHFITPQQAKGEFLPTAAFDSLLAYLNANGFQVETTALDSVIVVQGTVSQFQSAFGGGVYTYTNGTLSYYASTGAATFDGAYLYASNATFLYEKPAVTAASTPNSNVTFTSGAFSAKQLQAVYNATYFYDRGLSGAGQAIGLLDYYGSPTISSDLGKFDSTFGFPDASLSVIPVGPYDPNLGANLGWSTEVSLDAEVSHAMAPGAAIDLYVANGAVPLSVPLAKIVQDDKVTTLSQSFGTPEWYFSLTSYLGGPSFFALNALVPDQFYALGSVEGITFLASSGDGGGSGYSSGPEGNLEYPAVSPFVTSVGGTQTYFSPSSSGGQSFVQTAWSNIGFVPNMVNEGGGGGGVSVLEPKPWYQLSQATPPSYPNGRLNPDLSLQAGVDPATYIVDGGKVGGSGGTSESSPLLAGLLTLVSESAKGQLGLINPFIYKVGDDPAEYLKGFEPITFGYTIPWKASSGFNLVTGWGAPNVGELSRLLNSGKTELTIQGEVVNGTGKGQADFTPGEKLTVQAMVTYKGAAVTAGSFTMSLQTLAGTFSPTPMAYTPSTGNWTGTITVGQQSGISYVYMSGSSSAGVPGEAMGIFFAGYLGSFEASGYAYILPVDPWTWSQPEPLGVTLFTTDLKGNPAPAGAVSLAVEPYSIATNRYTTTSPVTLNGTGSGSVYGFLSAPVPAGPVSLIAEGDVYGYAPTVYGIYLQSSYIYPDVAAEPGSVAPGQYLTVIANPIAPVNVYFETSFETGRLFAYDVYVGSNVTASLVSPTDGTVSTADLYYQPCAQALRVCAGGADVIYGQLKVPLGTPSGLYTVILHASYSSYTPGGNLTGSFYGQVWVSGPMIEPSISIQPGPVQVSLGPLSGPLPAGQSSQLFQGEQASVVARMTYANSTLVTYGEYTAIVYPQSLASQYATLMHTEYAGGELIPLTYDPGLQAWVGNVTLPSSASQGGLAGIGVTSFEYSGPYEVYVTGVTRDGTPTTSALSAQQPIFLQPYVFTTGTVSSIPIGSHLAFSGATISASGSLSGDVFVGSDTIKKATVTISDSQVQGTLQLENSDVTLVGVSGGKIGVNGSALTLKDSSIGSLVVDRSSNVTLVDSSYASVNPPLPSIAVGGLSKPLGADSNYNATVSGQGLSASSIAAWIDGVKSSLKVNATSSGLAAVGRINATTLTDGVHTLKIVASNPDGMSSTYSAPFSTDSHELSLAGQTSALFYIAAALAAVSVVALILGLVAFRRKKAAEVSVQPAPPQV